MKTLNLYTKLVLFSFILLSFGCAKDLVKPKSITTAKNQVKDGPIPPYDFNWETATYMPSATTTGANPVPMPWNSGTTSIDPNIVNDYKKSDGWVLVHNTFSPTIVLNDPNYTYFFSIYNIYRGIIRFYLWQPASAIATTYVNHGLSLYGTTTSPMLNFNAQDIIDPTAAQQKFSQVLNQQISASGGTWFAFQYEMAYDPNIATSNFPSTGITFASQWANVSTITLNGSLTGAIRSTTLGVPNSDINLQGLAQSGASTFLGSVGQAIFSGATQGIIASALTSGASGIVKGFLSAVIGGASGSQPLDLTINTQLKLSGNMVNNGSLENMKLILPGQANSQTANGNTTKYNNVLGVFNVSVKPIIQISKAGFQVDIEDPRDGSRQTDYGINATCWFDPNAVKLIWNPAIINSSPSGATVSNINTDLIAIGPGPGSGSTPGLINSNQTAGESVGNMNVSTFHNPTSSNPAKFGYYTELAPSEGGYPYTPPLAVRVSFDVTPNNGGAKVTLVKTFWPAAQLE